MLKAQEAQESHKISKAKTKLEAIKKIITLDVMHHKFYFFYFFQISKGNKDIQSQYVP